MTIAQSLVNLEWIYTPLLKWERNAFLEHVIGPLPEGIQVVTLYHHPVFLTLTILALVPALAPGRERGPSAPALLVKIICMGMGHKPT